MKNRFMKVCSIFLVMVLLFNMLPLQALADGLSRETPPASGGNGAASLDAQSTSLAGQITQEEIDISSLEIVRELPEKRTEFTKEFLMSNGLRMATVYNAPVHYEENGQWKDIDNTLTLKSDGTIRNTAGVWDVAFPQQLTANKYITVTKDGYTLRFGMAGVLSGNTAVMRADSGLSVQSAQASTALVQPIDTAALLEGERHPETVQTKLNSKLSYSNVYSNTNIVYDLQSNKLKESVIIGRYDSTLQGYRYTLDVGDLVPVLNEDNSIFFFDESRTDVVMVMPAPFMVDAENAYNYDVQVQLTGSGSRYTLTYLLPQQWMAAEERAWPVVLDPVVQPTVTTANVMDKTVAKNWTPSAGWGYNACGYFVPEGPVRFYVKFTNLPALTSSDVVVNATVKLYKTAGTSATIPVNVHQVKGAWTSGSLTWSNQPECNTSVEDFAMVGANGWYGWVITDIVRDWYTKTNNGMMFKSSDAVEAAKVGSYKQFLSVDYGTELSKPILSITVRNANGLEDYWDYTASSAGRAGTGYVNNYTGNLVWVRSDMGFGGNRMPVSISHIYNLNDATATGYDGNNADDTAGNAFGLGAGWRTNYHQRIFYWDPNGSYYGWEDSDGTDHYFKYNPSTGKYEDEDNLNLTLTAGGTGTEVFCLSDQYGNCSYFDEHGRLTGMSNNQRTKSYITIAYDGQSRRITTITDGVDRKYNFVYADGLLSYISYTGTGTDEIHRVTFEYTGDNLTKIIDKDEKFCRYTYVENSTVLETVTDVDGYRLTYGYPEETPESWQPYQIISVQESEVTESGVTVITGKRIGFTYDGNQTTIVDYKKEENPTTGKMEYVEQNRQVMQFNNFGNTIAAFDDEGRGAFARYTTDEDPTGTPHQLILSSDLQTTVVNLLDNSGFEGYEEFWSAMEGVELGYGYEEESVLYGYYSLSVTANGMGQGVYGPICSVPANQTATFSAYVKTELAQVYVSVLVGTEYINSESITQSDGWTRLEVSYTNETGASINIRPYVLAEGSGAFYVDGVQLEIAPTASRYNLVDNGDFRLSEAWVYMYDDEEQENPITTHEPAIDLLNSDALTIPGGYDESRYVEQTINICGKADDAFILAGWGKGNATPSYAFAGGVYQPAGDRFWGLQALFHYADGETSELFAVEFNPDVENWQYAAMQIIAEKDYTAITVCLTYDYGANEVHFDGIQLFEGRLGTGYTYYSDDNLRTVTDPLGNVTEYTYYEQSNDVKTVTQTNQAGVQNFTYDAHHNVTGVIDNTGVVYAYTYDTHGNSLTKTATAGGKTVSTSTTYSEDGNLPASSTDTLGGVTLYGYNPNTGLLEWMQAPGDSEETCTTYIYDTMYRSTGASITTDLLATYSVNYTYSNDLLAKVQTATTTYNFNYRDAFDLRESIYVSDELLVRYYYTEDDNNYLARVDYGNSSEVYYTYDDEGRVIREDYISDEDEYAVYLYNKKGQLALIADSQSGLTTLYRYDSADRVAEFVEKNSNYHHTVNYTYHEEKDVLSTVVECINGVAYTTNFSYDDYNRIASVSNDIATDDAAKRITVEYTYDTFERVVLQITKCGSTEILRESFTYVEPVANAITNLVATYTVTAGVHSVTYSYTYDSKGNILSITSGGKITTYTYDNLNQLLQENNQAEGYVQEWVYDEGGNIIDRIKYVRTADGDLGETIDYDTFRYEGEGDELTEYNDQIIDSNVMGLNSLGNWTFEMCGNQLLSMWMYDEEEWQELRRDFIYNADDLRTKRIEPDGTVYGYTYHGSQLSQMTVTRQVGDSQLTDVLYFTYDAGGAPVTVTFNGTTYFYATNLQGDVVAILNNSGVVVAAYTYDAWGKILSVSGSALATLNPLRYRGYVYDTETGLYYLQSRYYNPQWGRFIHADGFVSTGQGLLGYNMFAYCRNNPVVRVDVSGTADVDHFGNSDGELLSNDEMDNRGHGGAPSTNTGPLGSNSSTNADGRYTNHPNNTSGCGKAPKQGPAGSSYTQYSSDGKNSIVSITTYNQYGVPGQRIDYQGRDHGKGLPHIHVYRWGFVGGTLHQMGTEIYPCAVK